MTAADERRRAAARERQRRHRAGEPAPKRRQIRLRVANATPSAGGSLCTDEDPELWFSDNEEDQALAKAICAACPVRQVCHAKAEANSEQYGIWAGEDRTLRRTRRRVA